MKRIHIVGGKNHGKTTLVVDLVSEFTSRGLHVGTIKHTHHHHELDTPGKDSHRHREAGAAVVGILSPAMNALFWAPAATEIDRESPAAIDARYESFAAAFAECDLILVEGDTRTTAPKLEVWRAARHTSPLADDLSNVLAIVTDDQLTTAHQLIPRSNPAAIADFILNH